MPVDAPLGTAARNKAFSVQMSTSTVGLPRESKISRARTNLILALGSGAGSNVVTPGKSLPSSNSREAPPPVLQCVTLVSVSYFLHAVAVSPPPMTVTQPLDVAATTLSMRVFVPASKDFISKTPMGPFQIIVLAFATASAFFLMLSGPQSRPMNPAGTPVSSEAILISPSSPNFEEQTKSTGRMISHPFAFALAMISSTIFEPSSSYRELPISILLMTLRNVNAIPPPMIIMLTLSNRFLMSRILSLTFAPPRIASKGLPGSSSTFEKAANSLATRNPLHFTL
mmetsp:Transcript_57344/g.104764  ORF Transcript_57344/g.104764 Transcript_57344/m.104764 type:complete len:284 (-) Transcript_57344:602-1453(-)